LAGRRQDALSPAGAHYARFPPPRAGHPGDARNGGRAAHARGLPRGVAQGDRAAPVPHGDDPGVLGAAHPAGRPLPPHHL